MLQNRVRIGQIASRSSHFPRFCNLTQDHLQKKTSELHEKCHQAEMHAAAANTKSENYQNRIKELEDQLKAKK